MEESNQRLGALITEIRTLRGMTQEQFAKKLGTSQSAVNRIEKGGQNLSLDMLARISDVLQKPLVSVGNQGVNLRVNGGRELSGEITLKTSKNAAVALLCASLLNKGTTTFKKFPRIEEVFRIIEVLESIGVKVRWMDGNDLQIKRPTKLDIENINSRAARKTRSVLMMIGSLAAEIPEFKIPYAGGCKLGERSVKPHLYGLEHFGVGVESKDKYYRVHTDYKNPEHIVMYESGDTVTENVLMAAARCKNELVIQFASANYMVQDVCGYLESLGVKIDGKGSTTLKITGVGKQIKKDVVYAPAEDPIEAMFFVSVALTTNSEIKINRVPIDFMALELLKLEKMGASFTVSKRYKAENGFTDLVDVTVHKHSGALKAASGKVYSRPYPGLNMDNLPYFVPIAAVAKGRTLIHDWSFENRAIYYTELTKIGATVELADPHRVYITGPTKFTNADLACPPALRPASLLLIGMLAAEGTSVLRNVYTINRGYEDLAMRLNSLGAEIEVLHDI
ncbi:UDP-N-acetylglucosamine 1-carboxyvinyltransferase [Candidatus Saccharibacteria bacterium]|nr:UDP-N-acetylglucosamine 1-carboxyvinyltransferase [Candidatus Saccharibacteria bacterium]